MTNNTQTKMAAILAAAQEKANQQTKPAFPFRQPTNFEALQPAKQPAPAAPKPLVSDIFPELSTYTIEDVLTGYEPAEDEPEQIAPHPTESPVNGFKIVDYSDKAFAILTPTKPTEDVLNIFRLHGSYNPRLKCGKGWIFSKRHLATVKEKLGL